MPHSFTVSAVMPAEAGDVYDAWLDSKAHAAMTGGGAARQSRKVGAGVAAWDGYISGKNLSLKAGERIVQSWRTTQFTAADADSRIDIRLESSARGTKVTLTHSNVPDGHTTYREGWKTHYFEPMKAYFKARKK